MKERGRFRVAKRETRVACPYKVLLILGFFVTAVFPASLLAQADTATGTLRGQVTDPSGSAVVKATTVLTTPNGAVTAETNRDGMYEFKGLAPGKYSLQVIAQGFTSFSRENIAVSAGQTQKVDVQLAIQAYKEQVTVTGEAGAALDTSPENNAGAIVIQGKDLEALSDDPDELQSDLQALAGPSAGPNGGQIYIDGFTAGQLPPKASIREIRINQNPFSVEYDKLGYGRIEIFTKPGTDQWHGQLYMSGTDSAFNSRNPFEQPGVLQPPYESTQFSGNIGGPLSKKASLFFNYEQRDINNLNVVSAQILDPSTFQPQRFSQAIPNPDTRINFGPRLDFQLTPNNVLTVRYQYYRQTQGNENVGAFKLASQGYNAYDTENTVQISDTQTLSATTINETRFQYLHQVANQSPVNTAPGIAVTDAFSSGGTSTGTTDDTQDHYELQNITFKTIGKHALKIGGRFRATNEYNTTNATFNGQYSFGKRLLPGCAPTPVDNCEVSPLQAYQVTLMGLAEGLPFTQIQALGGGPTFYSLNFNQIGVVSATVNYLDGAVFAQDDWKVKPNITVNYGLRIETQNDIGKHVGYAPRVGFAWGIGKAKNGSPKAVLRAGSGIFYDRFAFEQVLQQEQENGILQQQFLVQNPLFFNPNQTVLPSGFQGSSVAPQQKFVINPNLRAPGTLQTGVSLEKSLTKYANIAFTYLNSRGFDQLYTNFINANAPGQLPPAQILYQFESEGIFRQNQFIMNSRITLPTKVSLSLFGYYVLNYANSNTSGPTYVPSDPLNPMLDYGRSSYDYRNRVFMGGTVGMPKGFRMSPFLVVSSGAPFTITTGQDVFGDAQFNARPALANCSVSPGPNIVQTQFGCFNVLPQPGQTLVPINNATGPGRWTMNVRLSKTFGFGRVKEGAPAGPSGPGGGGTFGRGPGGGGGGRGGGGRGGFGGPGGSDSGATNRRYSLTFAVSARNIFNHTNLATPIGDLSSPLFGESNGIAGGPYGSNTANRRVDLQVTFSF